MNISNMKVSDIRPYEKNPRLNEGAVDAVAASIKEFGWRAPIVVDKEMVSLYGRIPGVHQLLAEHLTAEGFDLRCRFGDRGSRIGRFHRLNGFLAAGCTKRDVASRFDDLLQNEAYILIVVNNQNVKHTKSPKFNYPLSVLSSKSASI